MENTKKRAPNVDQKMFDCVKILLQSGATYNEIKKYTGLCNDAIARIKSAENWTEYQNIMADMRAKWKQKYARKAAAQEAEAKKAAKEKEPEPEPELKPVQQTVEHRQNVTIQTTYYVSQKLDAIQELLKALNAKLAFVVDELVGIPVKKEEKNDG